MLIYVGLFLWLCIVPLISLPFARRYRNALVFFFSVIPLTYVAANRSVSMGIDTIQYVSAAEWFKSIKSFEGSGYSRFEPLFKFLTIIISNFENYDRLLIIITSILIIVPTFYFMYKIIPNLGIGYVFYYLSTLYFNDMNLMRQCLANSIIVIAIYIAYKQHYLIALLTACLAFGFHYSAIIAIFVIFLTRFEINRSAYIITLIAFIAMIVFGDFIWKLFLQSGDYSFYENSAYSSGSTKLPWLTIFLFLVLLYSFINTEYNKEAIDCSYQQFLVVKRIGIYSSMMGVVGAAGNLQFNIFSRFNIITLGLVVTVCPLLLEFVKPKWSLLIKASVFFAFIVFFIFSMVYTNSWFGIFPYEKYI